MEKDTYSSNVGLKQALDEYQGDPRKDWMGYSGVMPDDERKENYLRLLLSDIRDASHDSFYISQSLMESTSIRVEDLSSLHSVRKYLDYIAQSPFFHESLLSSSAIDSFIIKMAEVEKGERRLKKRLGIILSRYKKGVLALPSSLLSSFKGKDFRKVKKTFEKEKKGEGKIKDEEVLLFSKRVLWIKKETKRLKELSLSIPFSSSLYNGIDTDWDEYSLALKKYRRAILEVGGFGERDFPSIQNGIKKFQKRFDDALRRYGDSLSRIEEVFSSSILSLPFPVLENKMEACLSSLDKLPLWIKHRDVFMSSYSDGSLDLFFAPKEEVVEKEKEEEVIVEEEKKDETLSFPPYREYQWDGEKSGKELVFDIVDNLSPIRERDALRLISNYGGEEAKDLALEAKDTLYEERNGFWYKKGKEIFFRESTERRDFSHIAPEELLSAMVSILTFYGKMKREELYGILGEKCGMKSVLSVRYRELDKVLFSSEKIKMEGDYVMVEGAL